MSDSGAAGATEAVAELEAIWKSCVGLPEEDATASGHASVLVSPARGENCAGGRALHRPTSLRCSGAQIWAAGLLGAARSMEERECMPAARRDRHRCRGGDP